MGNAGEPAPNTIEPAGLRLVGMVGVSEWAEEETFSRADVYSRWGCSAAKTESKLDGVGRESSSILLDSREREETAGVFQPASPPRWLVSNRSKVYSKGGNVRPADLPP